MNLMMMNLVNLSDYSYLRLSSLYLMKMKKKTEMKMYLAVADVGVFVIGVIVLEIYFVLLSLLQLKCQNIFAAVAAVVVDLAVVSVVVDLQLSFVAFAAVDFAVEIVRYQMVMK